MLGKADFIFKIIIGFGALILLIEGVRFSKFDRSKVVGTKARPKHWVQYLPKFHILTFILLTSLAIGTDAGLVQLKGNYWLFFTRIIGLIFYLSGALFAIWGAKSLGEEKAMDVRIRNGQQIIRSGAYSYCRHPMYLGAMMIWWGASFALLNKFLMLAAFIYTPLFIFRARLEEKLFSDHFKKTYENYSNQVPMIFPKFVSYRFPQQNSPNLVRINPDRIKGVTENEDKLEVASGRRT